MDEWRSRVAAVERAAGGSGAPLVAAAPLTLAAAASAGTVVLVEGISDQRALEALAVRRGRDLAAEGIAVVPMGGAKSVGRFLRLFGPDGFDVRLAGLCDANEEADFRRGLTRAGLGAERVEQVLDALGDLGAFRTFQKQPAQRAATTERQLRRFMGTRARRKILAAPMLVDALDPARVPRPLERLLAQL